MRRKATRGRTEAQAIQWLRRMGYVVRQADWEDGTMLVSNPQTQQCRQFESAQSAQACLLEQAARSHQHRLNQHVVSGGIA